MQINRQTYEEFLLLYIDGELTPGEKKAVEDFIQKNPDLQEEFTILKETVLSPDPNITFENKESLYRNEEKRKIILLPWLRIAAAAILLVAFGLFGWLYLGEKNTIDHKPVAMVKPSGSPKTAQQNKHEINSQIATTGKPALPLQDQYKKVHVPVKKDKKSPLTAKTINNQTQKETKEIKKLEQKIDNDVPDRVNFGQDIVLTKIKKENIEVDVKAREMEKIPEPENNNVYYTQTENIDASNDMIYFANTSLSKKTKLRGVFRKASRILDKITSLQ